jgi:arabinogalactan oligomer/maltooligosaccharide transport system substrate-binding protein
VNPNCENPKAAAALAAWLGSADAQLAHYEFNGTAPVSVALMTENEEIASNPSFKAAVDTVGTASIAQPSIPEMGAFWGAAEAMGNAIYNGEVTHDNAEAKTADFNVSLNETGL